MSELPNEPSELTTDEAAEYLKVTVRWIYTLIETGKLDARKRGVQWFVTRESLSRYQQERGK